VLRVDTVGYSVKVETVVYMEEDDKAGYRVGVDTAG